MQGYAAKGRCRADSKAFHIEWRAFALTTALGFTTQFSQLSYSLDCLWMYSSGFITMAQKSIYCYWLQFTAGLWSGFRMWRRQTSFIHDKTWSREHLLLFWHQNVKSAQGSVLMAPWEHGLLLLQNWIILQLQNKFLQKYTEILLCLCSAFAFPGHWSSPYWKYSKYIFLFLHQRLGCQCGKQGKWSRRMYAWKFSQMSDHS